MKETRGRVKRRTTQGRGVLRDRILVSLRGCEGIEYSYDRFMEFFEYEGGLRGLSIIIRY